jgi:glycerate-2-kinase
VALAGHPGVVVACFATDGVDGVAPPGGKPHAGAVVTGETLGQARRAGVHAAAALEGHDSYGFVAGAGVGLVTGATGTNVNDVWVGLAY